MALRIIDSFRDSIELFDVSGPMANIRSSDFVGCSHFRGIVALVHSSKEISTQMTGAAEKGISTRLGKPAMVGSP